MVFLCFALGQYLSRKAIVLAARLANQACSPRMHIPLQYHPHPIALIRNSAA